MPARFLTFVVPLLLAGLAAAPSGAADISDAWARATPGMAETGAAYLTIRSPTADRLTGGSTPVARQVELHSNMIEGGVIKMRKLAAIDLLPDQAVTLQPGALHLMLVGLREPLRPGQSFPLTLHFEKAGTREVTVSVGRVGAMAPHHGDSPGNAPGDAHKAH
jgi:periplasmic copper chaperone A